MDTKPRKKPGPSAKPTGAVRESRRTRDRDDVPPGDDAGAADLGRKVAENLRNQRKLRGLSLDDLAHASGVSRAALSQIETRKSNPTIGVLWKVASGLGISFAELVDDTRQGAVLLRRDETRLLRSADGRFESRPLAPAGTSPMVELYELKLSPRARHASEPHAPGTRELVVVLYGKLRMTLGEDVHELGVGDSIAFAADVPHVYENTTATDTRLHNIIAYAR
ncbi:MAG: helix-turn-helix domain-containing protein [Polyangiaceae bacterium]